MAHKLRINLPPVNNANSHDSVKDDSLHKNHSENDDDHRARPHGAIWSEAHRWALRSAAVKTVFDICVNN